MNKKQLEVCEELGWLVRDIDKGYELSKYSPCGEDYSIFLPKEKSEEGAREHSDSYNIEEHVVMWSMARKNGVQGIPPFLDLVEDAKGIKAMLEELADALEKGANENDDTEG